jgi:hypothetical protein
MPPLFINARASSHLETVRVLVWGMWTALRQSKMSLYGIETSLFTRESEWDKNNGEQLTCCHDSINRSRYAHEIGKFLLIADKEFYLRIETDGWRYHTEVQAL